MTGCLFFQELKRRNVFRVGAAYLLAAWVLLQIADFVLEVITAPDWVLQALVLVAAIGLPGYSERKQVQKIAEKRRDCSKKC